MARPPSDVAFTPSVKAEQEKRGSRKLYRRVEEGEGWHDRITPDLRTFFAGVRSFYLGTVSSEGRPYIQHRGGPPGFLVALDDKTLGFADYAGNRQYITLGNLKDNPHAYIFLMDYARRLRIKLWGTARVVEGDEDLVRRLSTATSGSAERAILFTLDAWDRNCNQHIPQLLPADDVSAAVAKLQGRITELEAEVARLRDDAQ